MPRRPAYALIPICRAGTARASSTPRDYDAEEPPQPAPPPDAELRLAEVWAERGSTVNLRVRPSRDAVVRVRVPIGEVVEVLDETNETWWYVLYLKTTGYMMREFLREQDG